MDRHGDRDRSSGRSSVAIALA